jgi:hypothetical protein
VPRQGTEIPTFGLIDRATRANPRRISALITNRSDAFISDTSDGIVCGDDMITATSCSCYTAPLCSQLSMSANG